MLDTPDTKRKLLRETEAITLMMDEHKVKGDLIRLSKDSLCWRVTGSRNVVPLIRSLYLREGIDQVSVLEGRGRRFIEIFFVESF